MRNKFGAVDVGDKRYRSQ